ncbi:hypothetical protein MBLNU230_g3962t1 [Neophaeotheca triangularis]
MDSMRHLSTSLPTPSTRQRGEQQQQPPQQPPQQAQDLGSAFRSAALSVTNLYKTAAAEQSKARSTGYQDALDDLLHFLDERDIGLDDGEGWRIRQWATERLEGQSVGTNGSEEDEQEMGTESRSSSPEAQRKPAAAAPPQVSGEAGGGERTPPYKDTNTVVRSSPQPQSLPQRASPQQAPQFQPYNPPTDQFTFRSSHSYPSNNFERENTSLTPDTANTITADTDMTASAANSIANSAADSVRIVPRPRQRHQHRRGFKNGNRESVPTPQTLNLNLGSGAGSKRKMPLPDIFDIPGFDFDGAGRDRDGKDDGRGSRGGKRGRFV